MSSVKMTGQRLDETEINDIVFGSSILHTKYEETGPASVLMANSWMHRAC
ncbi:MAG TPA: hypothetical protein VF473_07775 [Cyclobacteriaceae bacterium]